MSSRLWIPVAIAAIVLAAAAFFVLPKLAGRPLAIPGAVPGSTTSTGGTSALAADPGAALFLAWACKGDPTRAAFLDPSVIGTNGQPTTAIPDDACLVLGELSIVDCEPCDVVCGCGEPAEPCEEAHRASVAAWEAAKEEVDSRNEQISAVFPSGPFARVRLGSGSVASPGRFFLYRGIRTSRLVCNTSADFLYDITTKPLPAAAAGLEYLWTPIESPAGFEIGLVEASNLEAARTAFVAEHAARAETWDKAVAACQQEQEKVFWEVINGPPTPEPESDSEEESASEEESSSEDASDSEPGADSEGAEASQPAADAEPEAASERQAATKPSEAEAATETRTPEAPEVWYQVRSEWTVSTSQDCWCDPAEGQCWD